MAGLEALAAAAPPLFRPWGRSRVLLQELWQVQLANGCLDGLDGDRRAQLLHRLLLEADHLIRPGNRLAGLQTSSRIYQFT